MQNNFFHKQRAFITGITGQDGSYLTDFLLSKGYEIHGLVRRSSSFNRKRIEHVFKDYQSTKDIFLHYGDLTDASNLARLIEKVNPDELYNLGAQSHVRVSFDMPEYTANVNYLGALRLLEAVRETRIKTKFYQASTSEMFGDTTEYPQNERTPFKPRSPYAAAKVAAYWAVANYREAYGIFACNGILFNHESPRRGESFVTRKITMGVADIVDGRKDRIYLGNLDAKRDWGYAPEYVEAMWLMLQHEKPDDYVIATGESHSVREFVQQAFQAVGIDDWQKYAAFDPLYQRPTDVSILAGDASKAKTILGWEPKVRFKELVKIMVDADLHNKGIVLERRPKKQIEIQGS